MSESASPRRFFVADLFGWAPKCDIPTMEHPLFALRAGDRRVRVYERNGVTVTIKPGVDGGATIHDKDLWIYCISQLIEAANRGRTDISRTVRFAAYDFLVATCRQTRGQAGGRSYRLLGDALSRLAGTRIETNIETAKKRERGFFGLIDSAKVIARDGNNRMVAVEVTLPEWLHRSVQTNRVLTISSDYFRLRKPLERRLYELARKHCGHQGKWRASVATLHAKSGSRDLLKRFRTGLKAAVARNALPGYRMALDPKSEVVTFYARGVHGVKAALADVLAGLQKIRPPDEPVHDVSG